MNNRDKINALYLNLELILNALEELDEDVCTQANAVVCGTSGAVRWDRDARRWALETP